MVFRTYVEKRQGLAPECEALLMDCRDFLGVQGLRAARIWNRYDVEGIEAPLFENACRSVFSEPPLDLVSDAADTQDACAVFAVEPLPGQIMCLLWSICPVSSTSAQTAQRSASSF